MKKNQNFNVFLKSIMLFIAVFILGIVSGQTSIGILPVNTSTLCPSVLNEQDTQFLSLQIQDQFVQQLAGKFKVNKLSREHVLLLLKQVPSPDPENLLTESLKIICKNEKFDYLMRCYVREVNNSERSSSIQVAIIITDDNGKIFYEKKLAANDNLPEQKISVEALMDFTLKSEINKIVKEVKELKF